MILQEPVVVDSLVTHRCGQSLREEVWKIAQFWEQANEPFVGIRFFPAEPRNIFTGNEYMKTISHGATVSQRYEA